MNSASKGPALHACWDIVVIGLGGVGSFALRSLVDGVCLKGRGETDRDGDEAVAGGGGVTPRRRAASRVLGLERFCVGHSRGSSHGGTRIYRHAYFEHPDYVPLLRFSTDEFLKLERDKRSGGGGDSKTRKLVERCGNLIVERRGTSPPSEVGGGGNSSEDENRTPLINACLRSARQHSVPVEFLEHDELASRFPQFNFDPCHVGLFEPGGGFVRPEAAVTAAVEYAKANGAEVREGVRVCSVTERGMYGGDKTEDGDTGEAFVVIRLLSEDGTEEEVLSRKVIVAGGPWTGQLIPSWKPYLKVTRQVQAWIDVHATQDGEEGSSASLPNHHPDVMPTWLRAPEPGDDLPPLYGFPTDPLSDYPHRIKIALHGRKEQVKDPDDPAQRRTDVTKSDLEELKSSSAHFLRAVSAENPFVDARTCLYTVSCDEHFLLGQPAGFQCVYSAAGLSGHGFKMVPALGRALADLAIDGKTDMPIDFLSPSRFGV